MFQIQTFLWAFLGGILPALLWLSFWLREDTDDNREPKKLIAGTFIAGLIAVVIALFLERGVGLFVTSGSTIAIILWAIIEEATKFGAAWFVALRTRFNDEPVDSMVYLVTAALGFAALENAFFLIGPFGNGEFTRGFITGNLRFIGSSLLHVISSGVIGIFIAYSFCELPSRKWMIAGLGLILAIVLHGFFNFFILRGDNNLFTIFGFVWVGVVLLILFFERVKRINRTCVTSI